jgi:hypothetical protein
MAIPIWEDPDVQKIYDVGSNGEPQLRLHLLSGADLALVLPFIEADEALIQRSPVDPAPSEAMWTKACCLGVKAFENLSEEALIGWRKFVVYQVGEDAGLMWRRHKNSQETAMFAEWATVTINRNGWGPDGNSTPLGEQHSWSMGTAAEAGGGTRLNPATGRFEAPTGEAARHCDSVDLNARRATAPSVAPAVRKKGLFKRR